MAASLSEVQSSADLALGILEGSSLVASAPLETGHWKPLNMQCCVMSPAVCLPCGVVWLVTSAGSADHMTSLSPSLTCLCYI